MSVVVFLFQNQGFMKVTRISIISSAVYRNLFKMCQKNSSSLYPLLICGAEKMKDKLLTCAHSQLPGGIYWDPDPHVM